MHLPDRLITPLLSSSIELGQADDQAEGLHSCTPPRRQQFACHLDAAPDITDVQNLTLAKILEQRKN